MDTTYTYIHTFGISFIYAQLVTGSPEYGPRVQLLKPVVHVVTCPNFLCSGNQFHLLFLPSCQISAFVKVNLSWPDMDFCFHLHMPGASHHHKGCTGTPFQPGNINIIVGYLCQDKKPNEASIRLRNSLRLKPCQV
jgi:hypothetical protein